MSIPDAKDRKYGLEGFKLLKRLPVIREYMAKDGASEHWNEMHIIGHGLTIIAYETDGSGRVTHAYFVRRINSDYEITELENIAIGVDERKLILFGSNGEWIWIAFGKKIAIGYHMDTNYFGSEVKFYDNPNIAMCVKYVWSNQKDGEDIREVHKISEEKDNPVQPVKKEEIIPVENEEQSAWAMLQTFLKEYDQGYRESDTIVIRYAKRLEVVLERTLNGNVLIRDASFNKGLEIQEELGRYKKGGDILVRGEIKENEITLKSEDVMVTKCYGERHTRLIIEYENGKFRFGLIEPGLNVFERPVDAIEYGN